MEPVHGRWCLVKLVNLTPHPVNVYVGETPSYSVEPSGVVARIETIEDGHLDGAVVLRMGGPVGLPEPVSGTRYIVSLVLAQVVERADLWVPYGLIRDGSGQVVGCRGFAVAHPCL
jgi:hypothetical protein